MRLTTGILFILVLAGCTNEAFDPTQTETVVVEGFLYAGGSVDSIKLSQLTPLISDEDEAYEIDDAEVFIRWAGTDFQLIPSTQPPGDYYYPGSDLQILVGETYELHFEYFGQSIASATTVPTAPVDLEVSEEVLEIAPIEDFDDLFNRRELDNLEIYWSNEEAGYYYVLIENIEENPEEVNQLDFGGGQGNFNFVTEPTDLDVYNVVPFSLTQYGTYRVVLFHVSQEYVDLFQTADQDSRNLTEPLSNIENGLGIFTSFSSDTAYFEVVRP